MFTDNNQRRSTIVGLYGLPGCGKSYLLKKLQAENWRGCIDFVEGSETIASLLPNGLQDFHQLEDDDKAIVRQQAVEAIAQRCATGGRDAVVAGHYMFWKEGHISGQVVCTAKDLETYTHIIYLKTPEEIIIDRRGRDTDRSRPLESEDHLRRWQEKEISDLRRLCRDHDILFTVVMNSNAVPECNISALIQKFRYSRGEEQNVLHALTKLNRLIENREQLQTFLVLDGDKTLSDVDTGNVFWRMLAEIRSLEAVTTDKVSLVSGSTADNPIEEIFRSPLAYSTQAFQQAALVYDEAADNELFNVLCRAVADSVRVHSEFRSILRHVAKRQNRLGAVVVTCGLSRVWEEVLLRLGLSDEIGVIGGGRASDGLMVTPTVKAAIVSHLRHEACLEVWAFGDSPLDLPMLKSADHAIVVVGHESSRSKSMEEALAEAIATGELRAARQLLLPCDVLPRLDEARLPIASVDSFGFLDMMALTPCEPKFLHATEKSAAKLLMTPMRNALVRGPALREAHRQVGRYLATDLVSKVVGLETLLTPHPHSGYATGHRLLDEAQTCIVAIMRGGEPMALGVNDAFPSASLLHAKKPDDIRLTDHLSVYKTMILVDSVINNGGNHDWHGPTYSHLP